MTADDFVKSLKILPAKRLEKSMKATVQASGRLVFATDAIKDMELTVDKSIKIYETSTMDLGAVLSVKDDPEAFTLKHNGPYYYVSFKNFLQERGIDYKNKKIVYDITNLGDRFEGKTLYKFAYRELPNGAKVEDDEQDSENETPQPSMPTEETSKDAAAEPPTEDVASMEPPTYTAEPEEVPQTSGTSETGRNDDMPF